MGAAGLDSSMIESSEPLDVTTSSRMARAVTWKSLSLGLAGCLVIACGDQYGIHFIRGSFMGLDFTTPGAIALFFVLALPINTFLRFLSRRWALTTPELVTCFIMFSLACSLSTMGVGAQLLPIISAANYYGAANPEWGWQDSVIQYLPQWLIPTDSDAIHDFYVKGKNPVMQWRAWAGPLLNWAPFLLALYTTMLSIAVLIRKQWVENERLIFPLATLPTEMSRLDDGFVVPPLFRSKLLWVGFVAAVVISSMIALHNAYAPQVPAPGLFVPHPTSYKIEPIFRNHLNLIFRISLPMLGFFYLVNLDMLFSLWFFNLVAQALRGLVRAGTVPSLAFLKLKEDQGGFGADFGAFKHLGTGAMLMLVLMGAWNMRDHLKNIFRQAMGRKLMVNSKGEERPESLPLGIAFWVAVVGTLFMGVWLARSGLVWWAVPVFLGFIWVFFIGLTRVVAESGMGEAVASAIAPPMTVSVLGSRALGPKGLAALALTFVWCSDIRTFPLASAANGLKMADTFGMASPSLFGAMGAAVVVSAVAANWMMMRLGYLHGGSNLNGWFLTAGPQGPYRYAAAKVVDLQSKVPKSEFPFWPGYGINALGSLVMFLLVMGRRQLSWFPFHPLGFCVSTIWLMDQIWFTCFLAWVVKWLLLRYTGLRGFHALRPFFLGLVLGQFTSNAMWLVIDYFAEKTDNMVFWI